MRWVMTALSAATLAACGGSGPSNELPKGIKEISATAYPATTMGKAGPMSPGLIRVGVDWRADACRASARSRLVKIQTEACSSIWNVAQQHKVKSRPCWVTTPGF